MENMQTFLMIQWIYDRPTDTVCFSRKALFYQKIKSSFFQINPEILAELKP